MQDKLVLPDGMPIGGAVDLTMVQIKIAFQDAPNVTPIILNMPTGVACSGGLSKLEDFTRAAMAAMLASEHDDDLTAEELKAAVAVTACDVAEATLKELERRRLEAEARARAAGAPPKP